MCCYFWFLLRSNESRHRWTHSVELNCKERVQLRNVTCRGCAFALQKWNYVIRHTYLQSIYPLWLPLLTLPFLFSITCYPPPPTPSFLSLPALPFTKNPEQHPTFKMYYSKEWMDVFVVTLHNFFSTLFSCLHILLKKEHSSETHLARVFRSSVHRVSYGIFWWGWGK